MTRFMAWMCFAGFSVTGCTSIGMAVNPLCGFAGLAVGYFMAMQSVRYFVRKRGVCECLCDENDDDPFGER